MNNTDAAVGGLWDALNHPSRFATPQTVVEAVMWTVRERGVAALEEPANKERLSRCDPDAKAQINRRIKELLKKAAHHEVVR